MPHGYIVDAVMFVLMPRDAMFTPLLMVLSVSLLRSAQRAMRCHDFDTDRRRRPSPP